MNWLRETINDSHTGKASTKRVALLIAVSSLAIAAMLLGVAALFGYEVAAALGAVAVPLAGLGGYSYVNGKQAEVQRGNPT